MEASRPGLICSWFLGSGVCPGRAESRWDYVAEYESISGNYRDHYPHRFTSGCIANAGVLGYRLTCA
jgi:hypothetical protein